MYAGHDNGELLQFAIGDPLTRTSTSVRATDEEAEIWKGSLLAAMQAGEQEPGETDWVAFLVDVVERD
jgi:hypothetical protein